MEKQSIAELLSENTYPGRGILIGQSADGAFAVAAYFIMGRSENSRNRVFHESGGEVTIFPYDVTKVKDPSLIIYTPVRRIGNSLIVTNGDQTDTIYEYLLRGHTFEYALITRKYEPDAPNFTPRISGIIDFKDNGFTYKLSILKRAPESPLSCGNEGACQRFTYTYEPIPGTGHLIHTYKCDGNPIPSFIGEPRAVAIDCGIDDFASLLWDSLNADNKVSLYVSYTDIKTGKQTVRIKNKNE